MNFLKLYSTESSNFLKKPVKYDNVPIKTTIMK